MQIPLKNLIHNVGKSLCDYRFLRFIAIFQFSKFFQLKLQLFWGRLWIMFGLLLFFEFGRLTLSFSAILSLFFSFSPKIFFYCFFLFSSHDLSVFSLVSSSYSLVLNVFYLSISHPLPFQIYPLSSPPQEKPTIIYRQPQFNENALQRKKNLITPQ